MRRYKNIIIFVVLIVLLASFYFGRKINFSDIAMAAGFYDDKISVVATSDVHGHIVFEDNAWGFYTMEDLSVIMGLPVVQHFYEEVKRKNPNTLFLDSGDMFHGTNEANIEKSKGVVEVLNCMGYDAMTIGNHDFNFGFDRVMEIKSQIKFPILCANLYKDGKPVFQQDKIIKVGDKKVGLFGLTTHDVLTYSNSQVTQGLTWKDPVETAAEEVKKLRGQVDVLIMISHLGDDNDKNVAQKVDGIDLIMCGHRHNLYVSAVKVNNTYLVEPGAWTTHVGVADIYFKKGKFSHVSWKLTSIKDKSYADQKADTIAQKYHETAMKNAAEIIGKSKVKLNGIRTQIRSKETNLANLLTDAMLEYGKADLALMNGGGIRESIPKGDISLYQVGQILPFTNSLMTIELKGEKVYQAIERGLKSYPNGTNGGFLQVAGIQYEFDASKPVGERVLKIIKDGKPLDKEGLYKVALNDYLFNGGDNYEEFKDAKVLYRGELLKDVLVQYLKEKKEVEPKEEGRIKVGNERYKGLFKVF